MVLANVLNLALVLGDASKHIEDCSGKTNFYPDRENGTVNLEYTGEGKGFTFCEWHHTSVGEAVALTGIRWGWDTSRLLGRMT